MEPKPKCPCCMSDVDPYWMLMHLPKCYRTVCRTKGIVPLCTCDDCDGVQTHPGNSLNKKPSSSTTHPDNNNNVSEPSPKPKAKAKRLLSLEDNETPVPTKKQTTSMLSMTQLKGQCCVVCKKKKGPSQLNIPLIYIGKVRKIMICKKGHLSAENGGVECQQIVERVDQELQEYLVKGDQLNSLEDGSDNETETETLSEVCCSGLKDAEDSKSICGASIAPSLLCNM